jgi:hypothetical protein
MKILYFFLFFWVIFALLDPDPATQINADPQPCLERGCAGPGGRQRPDKLLAAAALGPKRRLLVTGFI